MGIAQHLKMKNYINEGKANRNRTVDHVTRDRSAIRTWVEERGGYPARAIGIPGLEGTLKIVLPETQRKGEFEAITWEEFFQSMYEDQLAVRYQDNNESRYAVIVDYQPEAQRGLPESRRHAG